MQIPAFYTGCFFGGRSNPAGNTGHRRRVTVFTGLLLLCLCGAPAAETGFGRFYTTPAQRSHLDELRARQPQGEIVVDITEEELPETEQEENDAALVDSITVDGIVYRSDGKNTAWVNRSNTLEGSITTQYTRVREQDVTGNKVQITLPDEKNRIRLKVGQQYDVHTGRVQDLVEDPLLQAPAATPARQANPSR